MSSLVDMSLEDIIKKKKRENPRSKMATNPATRNPRKQIQPQQRLQITDARNMIISKKRTQITDAREKLAELAKHKDARLKLEKLRLQRAQAQGRKGFTTQNKYNIRTVPKNDRVFTDSSRQVVSKPLNTHRFTTRRQVNNNNSNKFMERRPIERSRATDRFIKPKPIFRTVENDLEIIDDPMEDDFMPSKSVLVNRNGGLQLKIVTQNTDMRGNRVATVHRTSTREKEQSPPRPPSILKKRPMAAMRSDDKAERTEKPHLEFRIIVSNLRNTVTAGDIQELFGDIGGMVESRLVRPGTAEVIYETQEDAQKAVDLYHNRQLDGQPMNCLLVVPRSPSTSTRSSNKPALYSTNSTVEPDISTFHKVLFSNL